MVNLPFRKMAVNHFGGFKFILFLVLILLVSRTTSDARQLTLQENFEDRDLSQNPQWTGDLNDFTFTDESDNVILRLDTESSPNRSQIRTVSATAYGSWEFYVQVPATSSQNRVYFYLMSDDGEFDIVGSGSPGVANGYAIHTGSGNFDLVKIEDGQQTEVLLSSVSEIESDTGYQVKVTRDESGLWEIYVGVGYGSEAILDSNSIIDQTFTESQYFGIYVRYSSSNVQGYFFDDIIITGLEDPQEGENDDPEGGEDDSCDGSDDQGGADDGDGGGDDEQDDDVGNGDDSDSENSDEASDETDNGAGDGEGDGEESDGSGEDGGNEGDGAGDNDEEGEENDEGDGTDSSEDDAGDSEQDNDEGSEDGEDNVEDSEGDDDPEGGEDDSGDGSDDEGEGGENQDDSGDSEDESEDDSGQSDDEEESDDSDSSDEEADEDVGDSSDDGTDPDEAGPIINPGDLLISEFYYRVPVHWRTQIYDRPQYVELYNRSGSQLNLRNFRISGNNISIDKDLFMNPGDYLVITRGKPVFEHRFGTRNFVEADQFPVFNLTTDGTIKLENTRGGTVEELTYSASEWGGNGVSLERLSFELNANLSGNWRESVDALTGSPGLPNTVVMPTSPPVAESISVIAPRTIHVRFSRELDAVKSGDLTQYSIDQGVTITSVEFKSGGSLLQFRTADYFQQHTDYKFTYQQVEDIFGNKVEELNELNFTYENPFKIESVQIIDNQQLRVQFTLPVNLAKSGDAVFRLSNGLNPQGVQFINSKTALVLFGVEFATGRYELIVNQMESFDPDLPEQWIIEPNTTYPFYRFDEYHSGDIVINEFMLRPPDGYPRYIELYNRSGRFLNLNEWQIRRREGAPANGGNITDINLPLGTGEYIVVTTDINLMNTVFGPGPWIEMNGFPGFTQTTLDQIRLISPDGHLHEGVMYDPSGWGVNGIALERRSLNAPSSHPGNWSESTAVLLGTPGLTNSIGPTQKAPEWVGTEVIDSETIRVEIDGLIDEKNLSPNQFRLNGGLSIVQITAVTSSDFDLHLDSPMRSSHPYSLSVQGITDIFGNVMSEQQRTVVYYQIEKAQPGDVVINEFMYNEPDDYSRYIELYNRSEKIIDLSGWRQANNTGTRRTLVEKTTLIHPKEFRVITPDENLLFFFPGLSIVNAGNRLSALKNGGDSIVIENRDSVVIDSLTYTPKWGGKGIALERKSAEVPAFYRENWSESTANLLGTPGNSNTAKPDSNPPEMVKITQFENRGFKVVLNKQADPGTILNLNHYRIRPTVAIAGIELGEREFILNIESELINNQSYSITMSGITDIFGNEMETTEVDLHFLKLSEVGDGEIVINEILYRRKETGAPQFVELFNRTDKNFDLSGWTLSNRTGFAELPDDLLFPAMEYLVLTDSDQLTSEPGHFIQLPGFRSLHNTSDIVMLSNQMEITIDSLRYESSWQNNPPGVSLERRDPTALTVDPYNWMKSSDPEGSTPGAMNSRFEVDDQPPEIRFVNLFHPDSLEVIFNKFIDIPISLDETRSSMSTLVHSESDEELTPIFYVNGEEVPILLYDPKKGNRIVISPGNSVSDEEIILTVDNIGDHNGNVVYDLSRPVARPLKEGDLIFNEIMFQPLTDNQNGLPDQSEYIEVYNRRSYPISLEGIILHDEPDNSGRYSIIDPVSSVQKWIPSNGYLLFYPEEGGSNFSESRVAKFFNLSEDETMIPLRTERNTLSLPAAGRKIFLADSTGMTIDWVGFTPDWHNPNLIDNRGIALERINPELGTNDPLNWSSSANIEGGTPGKMNSIHQTPQQMASQQGVFLDPNPFSPDEDGYQDHLFINYKLDEPDYLIRIRIFDRYGRLVRNLVHGETAGFEGSHIWDGRTDDGQTGRIGIYIILLEAYNSSQGERLQFKETAVLARKF